MTQHGNRGHTCSHRRDVRADDEDFGLSKKRIIKLSIELFPSLFHSSRIFSSVELRGHIRIGLDYSSANGGVSSYACARKASFRCNV